MLPFLKKDKIGGISGSITMSSDGKQIESQGDESGLEDCALELMRAFNSKDPKKIAAVFKDMFLILESMPHEEYSDEAEQAE